MFLLSPGAAARCEARRPWDCARRASCPRPARSAGPSLRGTMSWIALLGGVGRGRGVQASRPGTLLSVSRAFPHGWMGGMP